jgi:hypothetical protein
MPDEKMLVEMLAEYAHKAWSGWMIYQFAICDCVSWMPPDLYNRWYRQAHTEYKDLPENEKESDRIEAYKILDVIWPGVYTNNQ